jgi:predicted DCC family thiol-disulfide oxidoreductase YuxK
VLVLPNQTPGLIERYSLSRADVDGAVWAIAPGGQKWSGAAAVNRALRELEGVWPGVAAVYRLPPIRWAEDKGYRWVADHRPWLSRFYSAPPEWKE